VRGGRHGRVGCALTSEGREVDHKAGGAGSSKDNEKGEIVQEEGRPFHGAFQKKEEDIEKKPRCSKPNV